MFSASLLPMGILLGVGSLLLAHGKRSLEDVGLGDDPLRVFAATFNAGNQRVIGSQQQFLKLTDQILDGHDTPGAEADIVVLGFQEFGDGNQEYLKTVRELYVWRQSMKQRLDDLRRTLVVATTPPKEVQEEYRTVAQDLNKLMSMSEEALQEFVKRFGTSSPEFYDELAKRSPARRLQDKTQSVVANVKLHAKNLAQGPAEDVIKEHRGQDDRFDNLSAAAQKLQEPWENVPTRTDLDEKMQQLTKWSSAARNKIRETHEQFPNLLGTEAFQRQMRVVSDMDEWKSAFLARSMQSRTSMQHAASKFVDDVKQKIQDEEDQVSRFLVSDVLMLRRALDRVETDLDQLNKNNTIARKVGEVAKIEHEDALKIVWNEWSSWMKSHVEALLPASLANLSFEGIDVPYSTVAWHSGMKCLLAKHLNTTLYVFMNPWSRWKLAPIQYASDTCMSTKDSPGCTINNNRRFECGKVVNLMVLEASREKSRTRLCLMNTHVSFAGSAEHRANVLRGAMLETTRAKCDSVVFVGDFNTRLHCDDAATSENQPLYENRGDSASSFSNIMGKFCKKNGQQLHCSLSGSTDETKDELTQMLTKNTVFCFEKSKMNLRSKVIEARKGAGERAKRRISSLMGKREEPDAGPNASWSLEVLENQPLLRLGLKEVAPPNFAPTYKYNSKQKSEHVGPAWRHCFDGEVNCMVNQRKFGKHNPAWTDRILAKAARFETSVYSRRPFREVGLASDHVAVVASVNIFVPV
eukprot:TRINITY_DN7812_c0_g1_i1.p1 TRINITY_DN7812_c0_g1~~TRINITY_DN7812_c0_g1_i1.p1  ORF type:complete len:750 (-),score=96.12 TRINITY_DN7812_c0_g1_i1:291-2540(-)